MAEYLKAVQRCNEICKLWMLRYLPGYQLPAKKLFFPIPALV